MSNLRIRLLSYLLLFLVAGCEEMVFKDEKADSQYIFDTYWREIDRHFAFFEYLSLDWDSVYRVTDVLVDENTLDHNLFEILERMTNLLRDGHTNLFSEYGISNYTRWLEVAPRNMLDRHKISHYFDDYKMREVLEYGNIGNLGYIKINTFAVTSSIYEYEIIDDILIELSSCVGLIIDVRSNGGGSSTNADLIARRFNDKKRLVFKSRTRNGAAHNDFTDWKPYYLEPFNGNIYTKPVAVLTNRGCYSSTEWFLASMDVIPGITIIGDTTGGGSGNPLIRELPNGWIFRISNTQKQLTNGRDFQYTGIPPDIPVWISDEDIENNTDRILEVAINHLSR